MINSIKVNPNYFLGIYTDFTTFFNVGNLISSSVK